MDLEKIENDFKKFFEEKNQENVNITLTEITRLKNIENYIRKIPFLNEINNMKHDLQFKMKLE